MKNDNHIFGDMLVIDKYISPAYQDTTMYIEDNKVFVSHGPIKYHWDCITNKNLLNYNDRLWNSSKKLSP
jgi:hypothetical protein